MKSLQEAVSYIRDTKFPIEISGLREYYLSVHADGLKWQASTRFDKPPSWKEIIDDGIAWAVDNNVRLSSFAEGAAFRHGFYGKWYYIPDEGKLYISDFILTHS